MDADKITSLLDLQQIDLARDRLAERREKLPERAELTEHEGRIAEVQAAIRRVQAEADGIAREESRVEEEVRLLEEKISGEEKKLYSGAVVNPKELSALQSEIEMLKRQKSPREDAGLELLETRDQLLGERGKLEDELAELDKDAATIRSRIAELEGDIDRELAVEDEKRTGAVLRVPSDVLEEYESIREQKKGIGVGALRDGICSACREALSAMEVDRIKQRVRSGEWLFRCEHCRRLLVVP